MASLIIAGITILLIVLSSLLFPTIQIKKFKIQTYWVISLIGAILLLTIKEDTDFDGSVYDFSQYEEKNIIGLIECKKRTTKHHNDDDEPQIALIPGQTVCKMKDGSYQWDFRGLM